MALAKTADNDTGLTGALSRATETEAYKDGYQMGSKMSVMGAIRVIGGALIMLGVILVVLNEVYTLDTIANSTGPFADQITAAQNTGGSALGLLIIGLLAAAGARVMGMFGGGGGNF